MPASVSLENFCPCFTWSCYVVTSIQYCGYSFFNESQGLLLTGLKKSLLFSDLWVYCNENMKTKSSLIIFTFNKINADLEVNIKLGWKDKASSAFEEFKCAKDIVNKLPLLKSYIEVDQKTKSKLFLKISGLQEIEEMGWCRRGVGYFSKWTLSPWHL